jgi:L-alanine-DL-glutamate epimerase-like enolase superfamily enzyme
MNRQQFLKKSLITGLGLSAISPLEAMALEASKNVVSMPPSGVKIKAIKTYIHPTACYVKVETDSGLSGWGEADHDHTPIVAKAIREVGAEYLIGEDPFNSEYLWNQIFYLGEDLGTNGIATGALAGIDNALWDLKGKLTNQPVHKLLGSNKVEKIKVYGSFGRGERNKIKTPEECGKIAAGFVEKGYDTVKLRMQIRIQNRNPEPDPTVAYVAAVRKAIGDQTTLFIDFNNGYTPGKAIELILKIYEKYNVQIVEEPVSYKDYDGLRQCVEASPIRIAAGEHEFNRYEIRDLITIGKADVINLDVIKGGGISEMKKAATLVQAFEREVMCHNARPTLATAATLQLAGSIYNAARIQEHGGERPELKQWECFNSRFKFENGYLYLPEGPGLGLEVNEKAMEKYLVS